MATGSAARTPFDQGVESAKAAEVGANPFAEGSIEFRNFELGRTFALQRMKTVEPHPERQTDPK